MGIKLATRLLVAVLLSVSWIGYAPVVARQSLQSDKDNEGWAVDVRFGFPVEIALNAPPKRRGMNIRNIFVFLPAEHFTQANIERVTLSLAAEHADPVCMSIHVYSDREMLARAVRVHTSQMYVEFSSSDPKGRRRFYEQHYPLKRGYFRAFFYRTPRGDESLQFSPDPEMEKVIQIPLRKKGQ